MKKLLIFLATVFMTSCTLFAKQNEIAIANRCDHDVVIHTSSVIGKRTLKPNEVVFDYTDEDCFILVTDIQYSGTYSNGQGWVDVQRMYFHNNGKDRRLEICEDGFWLDDQFIEPMDWN